MLAIEKIAKIEDVMEVPEIKILTAENYEEAALNFYIRAKEFVQKYGADALFENVLKFINNKEDEIRKGTYEEKERYPHYKQVYYYYDQFWHDLTVYFDYNNRDHKYFLKRLLDETKDAVIEEAKEKLAKKYTPYFMPRVQKIFDIEEFKKAIEKRKKLYIIADRMPAIREEAQELAKIALEEDYQAFIEIGGVTKEIKNNKKEEETEQTTVGCVILDLYSINTKRNSTIYKKKSEDSDLFIFLNNSVYKDETKYYTKNNAHDYCWHNTRKKVAVYHYKSGEEHPSQRITKGFSLYTNAGHYKKDLEDKERKLKHAKELDITYFVNYIHDAKKEGLDIKNIIRKVKGEDVPLTERERSYSHIMTTNLDHAIYTEEDKTEIIDKAMALSEEPEEKEELPENIPCLEQEFEEIEKGLEYTEFLVENTLNKIKEKAKKDGYTKNQLRQLFEKAIRAEKEATEISEDAQLQNYFYKFLEAIELHATNNGFRNYEFLRNKIYYTYIFLNEEY